MILVEWWKKQLIRRTAELAEAKEIQFGSMVDKLRAIIQRTDLVQQISLLERNIARAQLEETLRMLRNLLAVIHRDGGHYTDEHGLAASVEEAMQVVPRERQALDEERYRCSFWANNAVEQASALRREYPNKDSFIQVMTEARSKIESGEAVADRVTIAPSAVVAAALRTPARVPGQGLACQENCQELCVRTSGDVVCDECEMEYWRHPYCRGQVTTMTGVPEYFIHVACDGRHLKL